MLTLLRIGKRCINVLPQPSIEYKKQEIVTLNATKIMEPNARTDWIKIINQNKIEKKECTYELYLQAMQQLVYGRKDDAAFALLEEIKSNFREYNPKLITWLFRLYFLSKNYKKVIELYDAQKERSYYFTVQQLHIIIGSCIHLLEYDKCWEIYDSHLLKDTDYTPILVDLSLLSTLLYKHKKSIQFFMDLELIKIQRPMIYNLYLILYKMHDLQFDEALSLWNKTYDKNAHYSNSLIDLMLKACSRLGDLNTMNIIINYTRENNVKLRSNATIRIIETYIKAILLCNGKMRPYYLSKIEEYLKKLEESPEFYLNKSYMIVLYRYYSLIMSNEEAEIKIRTNLAKYGFKMSLFLMREMFINCAENMDHDKMKKLLIEADENGLLTLRSLNLALQLSIIKINKEHALYVLKLFTKMKISPKPSEICKLKRIYGIEYSQFLLSQN